MALDLIKPPPLWLPPKPALIRPAAPPKPRSASFCGPIFCPAAVTALTFVADSTSGATTCSLPTGSQAGDLCVLIQSSTDADGSPPVAVTPSGWTQIGTDETVTGPSSARLSDFYKVLTAADITAGSITGMNGNAADFKIMVTLRPNSPISVVNVVDFESQGTSGNPSSQTVTPTAAPCVLLGVRRALTGSTTGTSGTLFDDGNATSSPASNIAATYLIQNSSPTSKDYDTGDSGTWTMLQTFVLQVT